MIIWMAAQHWAVDEMVASVHVGRSHCYGIKRQPWLGHCVICSVRKVSTGLLCFCDLTQRIRGGWEWHWLRWTIWNDVKNDCIAVRLREHLTGKHDEKIPSIRVHEFVRHLRLIECIDIFLVFYLCKVSIIHWVMLRSNLYLIENRNETRNITKCDNEIGSFYK